MYVMYVKQIDGKNCGKGAVWSVLFRYMKFRAGDVKWGLRTPEELQGSVEVN